MDINDIFEEFQEMGLVAGQRDFGRFFGRSASWFSSSLARSRSPSIESWLFFLHNLTKLIVRTDFAARTAADADEREAFNAGKESLRTIHDSVQLTINQRVMAGVFGDDTDAHR